MLLVAALLALLTTLQAGIERGYRGEGIPWTGLLKAQIVEWLAYAVFVLPLWMLVRRFPVRRDNWRAMLAAYAGIGVGVAFAKEAIYVAVGNYFRPGQFRLDLILSEDFSSELLIAWSLIAVIHAMIFYGWGIALEARVDALKDTDDEDVLRRIPVRGSGGRIQIVPVGEIEVIASEGNYARLETATGHHLLRHTLSGLEKRLGERFLRIHRRLLVNLDHIASAEPGAKGEYKLRLRSGRSLTSARSCNAEIRSALKGAAAS